MIASGLYLGQKPKSSTQSIKEVHWKPEISIFVFVQYLFNIFAMFLQTLSYTVCSYLSCCAGSWFIHLQFKTFTLKVRCRSQKTFFLTDLSLLYPSALFHLMFFCEDAKIAHFYIIPLFFGVFLWITVVYHHSSIATLSLIRGSTFLCCFVLYLGQSVFVKRLTPIKCCTKNHLLLPFVFLCAIFVFPRVMQVFPSAILVFPRAANFAAILLQP